MSPFYLDRREVSAKEFRQIWPRLEAMGHAEPTETSDELDGEDIEDFATFSFGDALREGQDASELPINSVPWTTARAYCQELGKDLPTEAMYEYVASGLGEERVFSWGSDPPECTDAVIGRSGFGCYIQYEGSCRDPGSIGGPEPRESGIRDVDAVK